MHYLKFENIGDAEQRSRELWEEKLGRPKLEEDETEFMYAFEVSESDEGGSYLLIDDGGMILSDDEKLALESEASYQEWRMEYQPEAMTPPDWLFLFFGITFQLLWGGKNGTGLHFRLPSELLC